MDFLLIAVACFSMLSDAAPLAAADLPSHEEVVSLVQHQLRLQPQQVRQVAGLPSAHGTPLTTFRDAVVKRPTPPEAFVPIPEILLLQNAQSAEAATLKCGALAARLATQPTMQEPIFIQNGHLAAVRAMTTFADSVEVQLACTTLISLMVQWNWVLAHAMGSTGAIDPIIAAMKRFPDHARVRALTGALGAFTDFDNENRRRLLDAGLVELVYNATDKHYTQPEVAQMYNLWSTLCGVPEAAEEMVEQYGELERGVRAMAFFRQGTVRGEVIQVHGACFTRKPSWRLRSFEAGIVPEILSAISDEISGAEGELDMVGKERLFSNAFRWLLALVEGSAERRSAVLAAGALDQIAAVLQDLAVHGDHTSEHGFAEMQHDLGAEACDLLTQLMGNTTDGRQQFAQASSSTQLRSVLEALGAEGSLSNSCVGLLHQWPQ